MQDNELLQSQILAMLTFVSVNNQASPTLSKHDQFKIIWSN